MVGRIAAAAHVGAVHDVVVEQGGGVDELDDGGGGTCFWPWWPQARAASTTLSGRRRLPPAPMMYWDTWLTSTTSLASRCTMVWSTLLQVVRDQRPDLFELHSRDKPSGRSFYLDPAWYPAAPGRGNGGKPLSA